MGRGWGWGDQFTNNLGPRWTGSYHSKEGFQVSKGKWKRGKGESEKGSRKPGDCAIIMLSVYMHVHTIGAKKIDAYKKSRQETKHYNFFPIRDRAKI
jgi:hypothetical protein